MSRLLARIRRQELEAEQARLVEAALQDAGTSATAHRSAAADPARLRALPAIGPSVTGAIPGTIPGRSRRLDEWSGR